MEHAVSDFIDLAQIEVWIVRRLNHPEKATSLLYRFVSSLDQRRRRPVPEISSSRRT
jgi:hypothetical protein